MLSVNQQAIPSAVTIRLATNPAVEIKIMLNTVLRGRIRMQFTLTILSMSLLFSGCNQGRSAPDYRNELKLGGVEGRITVDGQPLKGARVLFELAGTQPVRSSYGTTDEDGQYKMYKERNAPGVMPGINIVRIRAERLDEGDSSQGADQLPARYNVRSELERSVEPLGQHVFDFELTTN